MEWSLKEHGDFLERQIVNFIDTSIPAYQEIWKIFIGHKGNGVMAEMNSMSAELDEKRVKFAQNHYTILESLYFMKGICDEESEMREIKNLEEYRKSINQVIAFAGYLGRVVDCIEKCFESVTTKSQAADAKAKLKDLYEKRHILLHGVKFPLELDGGLFMVPDFSELHGWHDKMMWNQSRTLEKKHLGEALTEILNALISEVSSLLHQLLNVVHYILEKNNLKLNSPEKEHILHSNLDASGSGSFASSLTINPSGSCANIHSLKR